MGSGGLRVFTNELLEELELSVELDELLDDQGWLLELLDELELSCELDEYSVELLEEELLQVLVLMGTIFVSIFKPWKAKKESKKR